MNRRNKFIRKKELPLTFRTAEMERGDGRFVEGKNFCLFFEERRRCCVGHRAVVPRTLVFPPPVWGGFAAGVGRRLKGKL